MLNISYFIPDGGSESDLEEDQEPLPGRDLGQPPRAKLHVHVKCQIQWRGLGARSCWRSHTRASQCGLLF